jgi:DHA2 family multidrug resistance protein
MGAAAGISIVTTVMTREAQVLWNQLGGHVSRFNPEVARYLEGLGLSASDPRAAAVLAQEVARQAQMIAMVDAFLLITWSFLAMLPLALLLRGSARKAGTAA